MNIKNRSNENVIQIVEEEYLKNGSKFWPGSVSEAVLVLQHGYNYQNIRDLFEAFDQSSSIVALLEKRPFVEVVWSAFCFISNNKKSESIDWHSISCFLLFTENINFSNILYVFFEKNIQLGTLSAKKGAFWSLIGYSSETLRLEFLKNLLKFLKLNPKDYNNVIDNCVKTQNYKPLMDFLANFVKDSEQKYLEDPSNSQKSTPNFIKYLAGFALVGGIFLIRYYKQPIKPVTRQAPIVTVFTNDYYASSNEDIPTDNLSSTCSSENVQVNEHFYGNLRGGASPPNTKIICSGRDSNKVLCHATNPCSDQPSTSQSASSQTNITTVENQIESEITSPLQCQSDSALLKDGQERVKEILEAPTYYYTETVTQIKDGKQIISKERKDFNYKFPYKKINSMQVSFETNGTYVTVGGSLSGYKEYPYNLKQCKERLNHVKTLFPNFPYSFEMRTELTIPQVGVVDACLTGDHVEGTKLHRATNRDRNNTVVVLVPNNIHKALTQTRKITEQQLMGFSEETGAETKNKTSFVRGDTIRTHYNVLAQQTVIAYELIDDAQFPPELPRKVLIAAEHKALDIQSKQYIKTRTLQGMSEEEQLVELKVNLAMDESLSDVKRLTAQISDIFDYCSLRSNDRKISIARTIKQAKKVIAQCENTRLFCLNCKKHYPRPA